MYGKKNFGKTSSSAENMLPSIMFQSVTLATANAAAGKFFTRVGFSRHDPAADFRDESDVWIHEE